MTIHPTAVVHPEALPNIDATSEVGPFCIIGPKVRIAAHTHIMGHAVLEGQTEIGSNNTIFPFASIGLPPQDLKYHGEPSRLVIGNDNVFRESCTVHTGTAGGGMLTSIGDNNLFMAYSHVAHDCHIKHHVIMANCSGLGGHVLVEDYAILGGMSGVHQFCTVGRGAFIAGGAMVTQDVPPFCTVQGDRARIISPNLEGLRRRGWSKDGIMTFREFFRFFFMESKLTIPKRIAEAYQRFNEKHSEIRYVLEFIEKSKRGICPYGRQS